jgi:hypothetical protein
VKFFENIEDVGGEGEGEHAHFVFRWKGQLYKFVYYYYSYNGYEFDGATMYEVNPVERMVTFYE